MNIIQDKTFDEERALYAVRDTIVKNCTFAGEADGESVLKETRDVVIEDCRFSLRYPIWHAQKYELTNSVLDEKTRAPLWYSNGGVIKGTKIFSVKALRECCGTVITGCEFESAEFGWKTSDTRISDSRILSYLFGIRCRKASQHSRPEATRLPLCGLPACLWLRGYGWRRASAPGRL